ncbi:hypothetical protein E7T09_17095 [Deinococcus sp. KSM4-11]|uniref:hypothetical protein n=1 Tax=Deinococcus sp. KSM4-11 TaxID=2568654 RepID=UPI0010A463B9|nr:hypothetical protein [Deinococcus sp. KSM4-11]THF85218.1 hypothetical protein E7T09_17095 [Deinococcus sp. KSM4-11]
MNFASLKATLQDQFPDYRIIGAVFDDSRGIVVVPVREAHPDPVAFRGIDVELDPHDLPDLQEAATVEYAARKVGAVLPEPLPVKSGSGYRIVRAS